MDLVYINSNGHFDAFNAVLSWAIVLGGGYGALRLFWDVLKVAGVLRMHRSDRDELAQRRAANASASPAAPSATPPPRSDGEIPPALGHEFPHGR